MDINNGARILIVEDDANTLNIMRDYLARAGFQVSTASNGWEALKSIKHSPVDLLISELAISDMDGSSLREKLVLNPETRDIPFFFLVPEAQTDTLVNALRSGVDDCITTPVDPVVLVARVQAAIERRRTYQEMVRVDPMTRLLNRATLEREARSELNRVERYKRFASLVLIDIDDFATVNSEHGVAMGDLLLTCLSGVILTSVRNVDVAGRYHGETFFLFLPETDEEGAEILAKRIQEQLVIIADNVAGFALTFTCGITASPKDGTDFDTLVRRAKEALNFCKENNKGGVAIWSRDLQTQQDA